MITNVAPETEDTLLEHLDKWDKPDSIEDTKYHNKEKNYILVLDTDKNAKELKEWLQNNPIPNSPASRVLIQTESFALVLQKKLKEKGYQLPAQAPGFMQPQGINPGAGFMGNQYAFQNQGMYNPQMYQMMLYQMQLQLQQGMNQHPNINRNDMFVRKAKGMANRRDNRSFNNQRRGGRGRGRGFGGDRYPGGGRGRGGGYHGNYQRRQPENFEENQTRVRIDSDNFPSLPTHQIPTGGNKEQEDGNLQVSVPMGDLSSSDDEGEEKPLSMKYLLEYFMNQKNTIKMNSSLENLVDKGIPLLAPDPNVRLEHITPTQKKEV